MNLSKFKVGDKIKLNKLDTMNSNILIGKEFRIFEMNENYMKAYPEGELIIITFPEGEKFFEKA